VTRDLNGDVWVAWWKYFDTVSWVHTYTVATASRPVISQIGPSISVEWFLSQSTPGSSWSVLRARDAGPFLSVARVQAGNGTKILWIDPSPPSGALRYRILRNCVDKRYESLSDETVWPVDVPPTPISDGPLLLSAAASNPSASSV